MKKDKVLKKWVVQIMKFALLGAVVGLGGGNYRRVES